MKKIIASFCVLGTAFLLSACETTESYDANSNYASGRTAGVADTEQAPRQERTFRRVQTTK